MYATFMYCPIIPNQAVEKILKSAEKVDVNERSTEGFAPLCIAAFWGYAEIVKMLLEHG